MGGGYGQAGSTAAAEAAEWQWISSRGTFPLWAWDGPMGLVYFLLLSLGFVTFFGSEALPGCVSSLSFLSGRGCALGVAGDHPLVAG